MKTQATGLVLAAVFAGGTVSSVLSQEPVRDVIDLCTNTVTQRSSVAEGFLARGWLDVGQALPPTFSNLLAGQELVVSLSAPNLARVATNPQTGKLPDITELLVSVRERLDGGELSVLWLDRRDPWLLMIYDAPSGDQVNSTDIYCLLTGSRNQQATEIFDAIAKNSLNVQESPYAPAKIVSRSMQGYPQPEPSTGLLKALEAVGVLPESPIPEPSIGAGKSDISIFLVDVEKFTARYKRKPEASAVVWTRRTIEDEASP